MTNNRGDSWHDFVPSKLEQKFIMFTGVSKKDFMELCALECIYESDLRELIDKLRQWDEQVLPADQYIFHHMIKERLVV